MTLCIFTRTGDTVTCSVCGSTIKFAGDERKLYRNCGADRSGKTAVIESREATCAHLGLMLREDTCDLCSMKGQPFEVLACTVHGECSLTRKHSKVRSCAACEDWVSAETLDAQGVGGPI